MPTKREKFDKYREQINKLLDKMSELIDSDFDSDCNINDFDCCISELSNDDMIMAILSGSISELVDKIHFNPDKPMEHNICRTDKNRHDQGGLKRENGQWVRCNSRKLSEEVYEVYFTGLKNWVRTNRDVPVRKINGKVVDDTVQDIWDSFMDSNSRKKQVSEIFELLYSKKDLVPH